MFKLKKEEYTELCYFIEKPLKIKSNWVWGKDGQNKIGKFHEFHGLNFNSSTFNILRIYFKIGKVEIFKENQIIKEKPLEDLKSEFIENKILFMCFNEYSKSKLNEIKSLVDFGLYEQKDLDKLKLRLDSLFKD